MLPRKKSPGQPQPLFLSRSYGISGLVKLSDIKLFPSRQKNYLIQVSKVLSIQNYPAGLSILREKLVRQVILDNPSLTRPSKELISRSFLSNCVYFSSNQFIAIETNILLLPVSCLFWYTHLIFDLNYPSHIYSINHNNCQILEGKERGKKSKFQNGLTCLKPSQGQLELPSNVSSRWVHLF